MTEPKQLTTRTLRAVSESGEDREGSESCAFGSQAMILAELRMILRRSGLLYRDVADRVGVSEATIKRQLRGKSTSLAMIERICGCVGLTLVDLADMAARENEAADRCLSVDQEAGLAKDLLTAFLFMLLRAGWSAEEAGREFDLSEPDLVGRLLALEKLKLIDLFPGNRVRLRAPRFPRWREDGPLRRVFGQSVYRHLIEAEPDEATRWDFDTVKLSPVSVEQLRPLLESLVNEAKSLAAADRLLGRKDRRWHGVFGIIKEIEPRNFWKEASDTNP